MKKSELRKKYFELRNQIQNRELKNEQILETLLNLEEIKKSDLILTYVSMGSEVDTIAFIKRIIATKRVAVPKIENNEMNFYLINSLNELVQGKFNIMEPTTNQKLLDFSSSCCLVPGICFNKEGYRIGYGGGYYDVFLKNYQGATIGLCYQECLTDEMFQESHDIRVKRIVCK